LTEHPLHDVRAPATVYYFARVFAPSRFRPQIVTVWESQQADGTWRVTVETEDGRAVAMLSFDVVEDTGTGERELQTVEG